MSKPVTNTHKTSLKGILTVFPLRDRFVSFPFITASILTIILLGITLLSKKDYYTLIIYLTTQMVSILPNILGFNLGGYALIVGFGNTELIKKLTKQKDANKPTVFQKLNGVFAFTLILQALVFFTSFFINLFINLEIETINNIAGKIINLTVFSFITLFGIWGMLIMFTLIKNIFTFGQLHHFQLTIDRIKEEAKTENDI